MNNYSFLDSSANSGVPRSAPSPQQQQSQHQHQQQQQQSSPGQMNQMNQMNGGGGQPQNGGGGGGVPLVNGLPSGGQQTDMNHLWSVVQQLSQQEQGLREIRYVGRADERDLAIQRVVQRSGLRGPRMG